MIAPRSVMGRGYVFTTKWHSLDEVARQDSRADFFFFFDKGFEPATHVLEVQHPGQSRQFFKIKKNLYFSFIKKNTFCRALPMLGPARLRVEFYFLKKDAGKKSSPEQRRARKSKKALRIHFGLQHPSACASPSSSRARSAPMRALFCMRFRALRICVPFE